MNVMSKKSHVLWTIIFLFYAANVFANKRGVNMQFELSLNKNTYIYQEPMYLTFKLTSHQTNVRVPLEYYETTAIRVSLFDENKNELQQTTGHEINSRVDGWRIMHEDQEKLETVVLPKKKTLEWTELLSNFVDIPGPGKYYVKAGFVFEPSGIDIEAEMYEINIIPSQAIYIDYLYDYISNPHNFMIITQKADQRTSHLAYITGRYIFPPSEGICLPETFPSGALIAKADFSYSKTFEYDMFRLYAGIEDKSLMVGFVNYLDDFPETKISYKKSALSENTALFGRPIQHEDKSITVFLSDGNGVESKRISIDGELVQSKNIDIQHSNPHPSYNTALNDGTVYFVYGDNGSLPVCHTALNPDKSVNTSEVLSEKQILGSFSSKPESLDISILFMDPLIRKGEMDPCIVVMLLITEENKQYIKVVKVPWGENASAARTLEIHSPVIDPKLLKPNEKIVLGKSVRIVDYGLFSMIATNKGNVFFSDGKSYEKCASVDPHNLSGVSLVESDGGDVYLLYPEKDRGLQTLKLFTLPKLW